MLRRYARWRLVQLLIVLWAAATLNFLIPRLAPGNPIRERLYTLSNSGGINQQSIEAMVRAYDEQFGLDQPLTVQYARYLWNMVHLDFGYSLAQYPAKVLPLILAAMPWTIGLLFVSTLLAFGVGTLLGALMAWSESPRAVNYLAAPLLTLSAVPYYLLGLVLVYLFALTWKIFPLSGGYTAGTLPSLSGPFLLDILRHSVLPALSIVLAAVGFWALGMRAMMITTIGEDFMIMAQAKGLRPRTIFLHYAVRVAVLPQITTLAIALGHVVSGAVLVEVVFGLPGIGSLLYKAISGSDYFVTYGVVFMIILAIGLATTLLDLIYPLLDPRITYQRR